MKSESVLVLLPLLAISLSWWCAVVVVDGAVSLPPTSDKPLIRKYYKIHNTCSSAEQFVRHQVKLHWEKDNSLAAKFLKLIYADCMVNGCDGSILLDGPYSEKTAPQNSFLGGFEAIDDIKTVLEAYCPGAVSCADILHLAARDAVHLAGAPSYPVFLGRRDGSQSNAAWVDYPSPSSSFETTYQYFESKGLDILDMTTLLGAHSMGKTHCKSIHDRLYDYKNTGKPDPSMKKSFLNQLRKQCPKQLKSGQSDPFVYLDADSGKNYKFTNSYYSNLQNGEAVLGVDQRLEDNNVTNQITREFAEDFEDFRKSFALSVSRMGSLKVLTGNKGEIRRNCRRPNKK